MSTGVTCIQNYLQLLINTYATEILFIYTFNVSLFTSSSSSFDGVYIRWLSEILLQNFFMLLSNAFSNSIYFRLGVLRVHEMLCFFTALVPILAHSLWHGDHPLDWWTCFSIVVINSASTNSTSSLL